MNSEKVGNDKNDKIVTLEEKIERAEEIAAKLSDSNMWKSHRRPINIKILEEELKLKIEDFGKDRNLSNLIKSFNRLIIDYIKKIGVPNFVHTRKFI